MYIYIYINIIYIYMHIRKYSHPEVDEDSHILLEEKLHQAVSPGKQKLP